MITQRISSSGTLVLKPSTSSQPVNSAIFWDTGEITPPVILTTLFFLSSGFNTRGPPNPPAPALTITSL